MRIPSPSPARGQAFAGHRHPAQSRGGGNLHHPDRGCRHHCRLAEQFGAPGTSGTGRPLRSGDSCGWKPPSRTNLTVVARRPATPSSARPPTPGARPIQHRRDRMAHAGHRVPRPDDV